MRFLAAAATIAVCLVVAQVTEGEGPFAMAAFPQSDHAKQTGQKPGGAAAPSGGAPTRGRDTCRWARDSECDEPDIGTGACAMGTDYSDCRPLREGEDDSCRWARDGECDEPHFGTGACAQGTDRTDCGDVAWLRNQTDRCRTAYNGVCEDPARGGQGCETRTDRSDCYGRQRPMSISDHFFGHDDRVLVNIREAPWRFVGLLRMAAGATCTATLIGPDVAITAAHCIHAGGRLNANGTFIASGGETARIVAYHIDRSFNYARFTNTDEIDGMDWALLRLDRRLGDSLGYAGVRALTIEQRARETDLMHAGYSWDTGEQRPSGHLACRIVTINRDNTFFHECDTTRGDSGSSFLVRNARGGFDVIGVDSAFRSNPGGHFLYVAVSATAFAPYVSDFVAGRVGAEIGGRAAARPGAQDSKPAGRIPGRR